MKCKKYLVIVCVYMCICMSLAGCGRATAGEHITAGMEAIAQLDYQGALVCFEAARNAGENLRLIARGSGIASMGLADYDSAVAYLEECLSYSDGWIIDMDYDVNYYLAAAHCKRGDFGAAERIYTAILDLKKAEVQARFLRGNARMELGRTEQAIEDFEKVMELVPADYDQLIGIYEVMASHGWKEQGQLWLESALEQKESKMSSYEKGRICYYLEEYQQACAHLEDAKKLGTAEVYLYLGKAYEATGDYNYAITNVYNSYLSRHEGDARIYNQLGLCYLQRQDYGAALEAFQKAMQIPDNGMMQTLQFNEVVAYEYLGEFANAEALLSRYLSTYPDDQTAAREYGFLMTR